MAGRGDLPPDWSDLAPEVGSHPRDIVILKRQWGAFYGTDLDLQLRRRKLATIVLCGIATEFGVESTARDAYERGYELLFAEDAMTGRNAESHTNSLARIFPRLGRVRRTDEIIAALGATDVPQHQALHTEQGDLSRGLPGPAREHSSSGTVRKGQEGR